MPRNCHRAARLRHQDSQEKVTSMPFACSICGEESTQICARCTKDACDNHLCAKCLRCSDCCECEVVLDEHLPEPMRPVVRPAPAPPPEPETLPEAPLPIQAEPPAELQSEQQSEPQPLFNDEDALL